jgi:hypothetical protein
MTLPSYHLQLIAALAVGLASSVAAAPTPEMVAVLMDYNQEFDRVREPSDKILRAEGSKRIGKMVRESRTEEAKLAGAQIEDKIAGEKIVEVHSELKQLFELYDNAVTSDANPVRERYLNRVDGLVKALEGKDTQAILALNEAKKAIDSLARAAEIEVVVAGHLFGEWNVKGSRLGIHADHTTTYSINGNKGTWRLEGTDLVIEWSQGPGITNKYSVLQSGDTLEGFEKIGRKGKWEPVTGTRKR